MKARAILGQCVSNALAMLGQCHIYIDRSIDIKKYVSTSDLTGRAFGLTSKDYSNGNGCLEVTAHE